MSIAKGRLAMLCPALSPLAGSPLRPVEVLFISLLAVGIPVSAEGIVFFSLPGIAKDFVGFIDFLELLLCCLIALVFVGVIFHSQFPEGLADIVLGGGFGDAQCFIIIFIVH